MFMVLYSSRATSLDANLHVPCMSAKFNTFSFSYSVVPVFRTSVIPYFRYSVGTSGSELFSMVTSGSERLLVVLSG